MSKLYTFIAATGSLDHPTKEDSTLRLVSSRPDGADTTLLLATFVKYWASRGVTVELDVEGHTKVEAAYRLSSIYRMATHIKLPPITERV